MAQLYANPYGGFPGFYFDSLDDYEDKQQSVWGDSDPEHSIDFINGSTQEQELWSEGGNDSPAEIEGYYDLLNEPDYIQEMVYAALALGIAQDFEGARGAADDAFVRQGDMQSLAEEFVEEEMVNTANYFDYERYGRDLRIGGDMTNDLDPDDPDEADSIRFYENMSDQELGEHVVDNIYGGQVNDILSSAPWYVDIDAVARDLEHDYVEFEFGGQDFTARFD